MTRMEALAEAQRRWGPTAYADAMPPEDTGLSFTDYAVGYDAEDPDEPEEVQKGHGDSWEAAFADADRRAK